MFDWLFETYNISNYDTRPGAGITLIPNKTLGLTVGSERPLYPKEEIIDEDDDESEEFSEDASTNDAIAKKLNMNPAQNIDPQRSTVGLGSTRFHLEEEADHTNMVVKGLSPRLTYRGASSKGTEYGTTFIRSRPGRKTGTQYGTSRAPIDLEMDDPLMFGEEPKDKFELSFLKQQRNLEKIRKLSDSLENDKKSGYLRKAKNMY
tara:strand:+ start:10280 stop:10894 length:615 start_codon:yes stop_codon:yes gene_type:complete